MVLRLTRSKKSSILLDYICDSCLAKYHATSSRINFAVTTRSLMTSPARSRKLEIARSIGSVRRSIAVRGLSTTSSRQTERHGTRHLLPKGPARTRFAPSPTGYLHLGSLRTALFNYLLAKKTGGQFILRVEDTDQKRLVRGAEERLCDDLRWAGLQWDEGPQVGGPFGPHKQSERTQLYREHAETLLESGAAYRCFCQSAQATAGPVDMSQIAASAGGCQSDCQSLKPEEAIRRAENGERHVVRFGQPLANPKWTDLVYGKMSLDSARKTLPSRASIADVILLKGDGTPTYHLANVVDDHAMKITHVIRGTEWMSSTALHIALYDAFGWQYPEFAHVGLLTDEEQAKLSKRNFDTDIKALREKHGILPESLTNFLALLGWRNPQRNDIMDLQELTNRFDLKFTRGNTIVSLDKLWYMQRNHAKARIERAAKSEEPLPAFDQLADLLLSRIQSQPVSEDFDSILNNRDLRTYVKTILLIDPGAFDNPTSYLDRNTYFFHRPGPLSDADIAQTLPAEIDLSAMQENIRSFISDPETGRALLSSRDNDLSPTALWNDIKNAAMHCNDALVGICREHAKAVVSANDGEGSSKPAEAEIVALWTRCVHAYMRGKLTGGASCPSTGFVMAVLGYEECRRRVLGQ